MLVIYFAMVFFMMQTSRRRRRAPNRTTTNDLEFVARQPNERISLSLSLSLSGCVCERQLLSLVFAINAQDNRKKEKSAT